MAPRQKYHYIGENGKRYLCQLKDYNENGEEIYSFLAEHSGDRLNIKKVSDKWVYHGGVEYYKTSWIEELGEQVDSKDYV